MSCRKAQLDMAVVYRGEFTATKFWQAHHKRKVTEAYDCNGEYQICLLTCIKK